MSLNTAALYLYTAYSELGERPSSACGGGGRLVVLRTEYKSGIMFRSRLSETSHQDFHATLMLQCTQRFGD